MAAEPAPAGRASRPAAGAVVVAVVDPGDPGQADPAEVSAAAVREGGTAAAPVRGGTRAEVLAELARRCGAPEPGADGRFVVVDAAVVCAPTLLGDLVAGPGAVDDVGLVLRDGRGRVVALRVPAAARAAVAGRLGGHVGAGPLVALVDAAVAAGVTVSTLDPAPFRVDRPVSADEAVAVRAWHAADDEPRLRLRRASRSDDGFLSTFLVRPPSRPLTRAAVALGVPASAVTVLALLLGLGAAAADGGGGLGWRLLGSLLLLLSLVVDCVDGQVARLTRTTSALGAWLDVGADRVKEYAVYAGLASGTHQRGTWVLALAAMGLLVTRHHVDFAYAAARAGTEPGSAVAAWSARTDARSAALWAKRFVIQPVGERTLVLVVLAPAVGVRTAFIVLLAWGVLAAAWTTAGRFGRTVLAKAWPGVRPATDGYERLWWQAGLEPTVPQGRRAVLLAGRGRWLVVPAARAVEQLGVLVVIWAAAPRALAPAFGWLAVVAFGQYDLVYRQRLLGEVRTTSPLRWLALWQRLLLVVLVVIAFTRAGDRVDPAWRAAWLAVLAAVLAVVLLVSSVRRWRASIPSTP